MLVSLATRIRRSQLAFDVNRLVFAKYRVSGSLVFVRTFCRISPIEKFRLISFRIKAL